jgi:type IV secretory pathway protease TraF
VVSLEANGDLVVRGDNPNVSRDSREFGPVPRRLVVGRVVYRYLPGERRGRVG